VTRSTPVIAGFTLLATLLGGCGSSKTAHTDAAAPNSPASSTAASSRPGSMAVAPSASGSAGKSGAPVSKPVDTGGPGSCHGADIGVTLSPVAVTGGHGSVTLHFNNSSGGRCTLTGYPSLAALLASGKEAVQAKRPRVMTTYQPVSLAPGQSAKAEVDWASSGGNCADFSTVRVTPPGTTVSVQLAASGLHVCDNSLQIHQVRPE